MRRCHPSDGKEFAGADSFFLRVEQFIAQMEAFDQADHHAIATNLQRAPFGAFKTGRGLDDARRFYD